MFLPLIPETPDTTPEPGEERTIYNIPEANWPKFEAQIAKLSRKAERIAGFPIKPMPFGYHYVEEKDGSSYKVIEVYLMSETPKVEGWTLAARLDHSQETGTIVRSVPNLGFELPSSYRDAEPVCDHCKVRRYRRDTFVLRCEETSEFKQVGASCLKDFFGHDPLKIARLAEYLGYADECGRGFEQYVGGDRRYVNVEEFLGHTAAMIRLHGWVSGKAAYDNPGLTSTKARALENMFPDRHSPAPVDLTDEDKEIATTAREWAAGLRGKSGLSDYEHNIAVLGDSLMMESRACGLAASIVSGYLRVQNRLMRSQTLKDRMAASQHVGKEGERLTFKDAEVISYFQRESDWGTTFIYKFLTAEGNVLTYFSTRYLNIREGATVTITATVKKHDVYEGVLSTIITRGKVAA